MTLIASADWRADVRARMNPEADLFAILDSRGFVLADWIGERYVEITWDGEDIALDVDSDQIADLEQWVVDDGTLVIAFSAYDGRGSYQPTGTMGLRG